MTKVYATWSLPLSLKLICTTTLQRRILTIPWIIAINFLQRKWIFSKILSLHFRQYSGHFWIRFWRIAITKAFQIILVDLKQRSHWQEKIQFQNHQGGWFEVVWTRHPIAYAGWKCVIQKEWQLSSAK